MGPTTNNSDRVPWYIDPAKIIVVSSPADFGATAIAPDGVARVPLVPGAAYHIRGTFPVPRMWVPKVVAPGTFDAVVFVGTNAVTMLFDGDDTPHIWGRDIGAIAFFQVQLADISNGGLGRGTRLLDLVGANGPQSVMSATSTTFSAFGALGNLVDVGLVVTDQSSDAAVSEGWVVRLNTGSQVGITFVNRGVVGSPLAPDNAAAALNLLGDARNATINGVSVKLGKPGNSFLFLDQSTPAGSIAINGNNYEGTATGAFFRPDVATAITAQTDDSVAVSSFSDSAAAPGVDTTVNMGVITDVVRGQTIRISGGTYDGTYEVVRVADDQQSFDIAVVFAGASAGTLALTTHTVGVNNFVRDETVTISGTTNYDGTFQIVRKTATTFTLPQPFVIDEATGTASSMGRDQKSLGVVAKSNGAQADSAITGEATWNGNATATTISDGVYVPLALTGVTLAAGSERVTLGSAAAGRLVYEGEAPVQGNVILFCNAQSPGSNPESYRIAIGINQTPPVFASAIYSPLELRDLNKQVAIRLAVQLDPGDEIQPYIAGDGTTTSVTVTDGQFSFLV